MPELSGLTVTRILNSCFRSDEMKLSRIAACLLAAALPRFAVADNARFDLPGPKVEVRITRGNTTLPIAEVPNLQPGDKIWVKADLPPDQSNHLLLVLAFLRGTTNEPPDSWFTEIDTWDKKTLEGTTVTIPADAQQALLFIAPETGGDFKTLRSAVKGKPGLFIRADSDLNQASFEQQRIERYLAAMKTVSGDDQKVIQDRSAKLAATLALKPNADCFKQPVDQQVSCLTQSSAPVLLDDGHGQSIAEALSTGASSDFINAASTTQVAGAGVYSAYVGAIVDLVHLTTLLRTAQYQYIPAISFPQGPTLDLKLNTPPSFHNPKSVIVIGLPEIQKANLPPLKPQNPDQVACLLAPKMTLPLVGAPLVFSTGFAHDLVLRVNRPGAPTDIPLTADAFEGGLVVAAKQPREPLHDAGSATDTPSSSDAKKEASSSHPTDLTVTGTVRGFWGFDAFDGPTLTLQQVDGKAWKVVGNTQLLAGQDNHLTLGGEGTACIQKIELTNKKDKNVDVAFKPGTNSKPGANGSLDLDIPMKQVQPGDYALTIQQFGDAEKTDVPLTAFTADIHLDTLKLHQGDSHAVLTGQHLDEVVSVQIADQTFTPTGTGTHPSEVDLEAKAGVSPNDGSDAAVKLKDGRTLNVKVSTEAARPSLALLSFQDKPSAETGTLPLTLGAKDEIPLRSTLTFVVQTKNVFPRSQTVEVGTLDDAVHTSLSLANDTLVLQDEHTAIATLDPLKAFGQSAFGKLQMRPVAADGTTGAWAALGTLVRRPQITAVQCAPGSATCTLHGHELFLVQAFAADKNFANPAAVPTGFADDTFTVPVPADGATLFLKLRDDPDSLASVTLPTPIATPSPAGPAATPASVAQPGPAAKPSPAAPASAPASVSPGPAAGAAPQTGAVPAAGTPAPAASAPPAPPPSPQ